MLHLPLPPAPLRGHCVHYEAPDHSFAENFFRGKRVHTETILFCLCFVGIHFFNLNKQLWCDASGGAGSGGVVTSDGQTP
jgi:hypothetical protein